MKKWIWIAVVLVALYLVASIVALIGFGSRNSFEDKIVIVPLEGVITTTGDGGALGGFGISSTQTIKYLKELKDDNSVKGVIFEINSPGGTVVASQEISDAVKNLNKTNYAVIREVGASGGYWIASSSDKIYVSPMSITGSIGVIGSYLEFSGLFEKYGVDYERLVAGEKKDIGTPYRDLKAEERLLLETKLGKIHEFFIREVAENRNMDVEDVRNLATGEFYLGQEAFELGLVDQFGNTEKAVEEMKTQLNITDVDVVTHTRELSLFDILSGRVAYQFGRGFGDSVVSYKIEDNFNFIA